MTFLDTNVLVYRADGAAPSKQRIARELTRRLIRDGEALVSTQVLQELYVVLTRRFRPIVSAVAAARLVDAYSRLDVVHITPALIVEAIATHQRHAISFWDALVVRAAVAGGADRILSEDFQDGSEIDGVRIENPFSST